MAGYLYEHSITTLVIVVATVQVLALVFLAVTTLRPNAVAPV